MKTVSGQGSPLVVESSLDCLVIYASFVYFSESYPESSLEENLATFLGEALRSCDIIIVNNYEIAQAHAISSLSLE